MCCGIILKKEGKGKGYAAQRGGAKPQKPHGFARA